MLNIEEIKKGAILRVAGEDSLPFVLSFVVTKGPYLWRGEQAFTLRTTEYHGRDRYKLRIPDANKNEMCKLYSYFEDNFICCVDVVVS